MAGLVINPTRGQNTRQKMSTFPIKIRNNSGLDQATPIFLAVTGIDESISGNTTQQFFNANPDKNVWQDASSSVLLSTLPKDNDGDAVLNLPFIKSGIVFLSINDKLTFNGTSQPDFSNPSNPSYKTLFDKFEISFLPTDGHPFINTTNVDFFCIPFSLQETLVGGAKTGIRNFTKSRKEILDQFSALLGTGEWSKLILKEGDNILRVVAPNKALVPPNNFDASFFQAYVNKVWDFYSQPGNTLTVDMSEIGINKLFVGSVVADQTSSDFGKFVFSDPSPSGGNSTKVKFTKPMEADIKDSVFGCADLFNAPNGQPQSIPAKNLGAAFNVGILALQSGNLNLTPPTSTLAANGWADHKPDFYKQTLIVGTGASATVIDCYNLYSKILHMNAEGGVPGNGLVYGFSFDDVTGSDPLLADANAVNAILTIQNLQMSPLGGAPRRNENAAGGRQTVVSR